MNGDIFNVNDYGLYDNSVWMVTRVIDGSDPDGANHQMLLLENTEDWRNVYVDAEKVKKY